MIKQFNFYDIYGHLLPGLALWALVYAPIGWVRHQWPSADLGSAALAVAAAYIVGLLVQRCGERIAPAKQRSSRAAKARYPSSSMLDKDGSGLPAAAKSLLAAQIQAHFGLDVQPEAVPTDELDKIRQTAFLQCRRRLLDQGRAQYAEQFEGLYTMMRGFAFVFAGAAIYFFGIVVRQTIPDSIVGRVVGVASAATAALFFGSEWLRARTDHRVSMGKWKLDAVKAWNRNVEAIASLLAFAVTGVHAGRWIPPSAHFLGTGLGATLAAAVVAAKFFGGYQHFQRIFADTVYRDFLTMASTDPARKEPTAQPSRREDPRQ